MDEPEDPDMFTLVTEQMVDSPKKGFERNGLGGTRLQCNVQYFN